MQSKLKILQLLSFLENCHMNTDDNFLTKALSATFCQK